jgi:hypothetical protein
MESKERERNNMFEGHVRAVNKKKTMIMIPTKYKWHNNACRRTFVSKSFAGCAFLVWLQSPRRKDSPRPRRLSVAHCSMDDASVSPSPVNGLGSSCRARAKDKKKKKRPPLLLACCPQFSSSLSSSSIIPHAPVDRTSNCRM